MEFDFCKLEIFIPEQAFCALQSALCEADAGYIGKYDCCLSYSRVTGCWRPLAGASPFLGAVGEISSEPELKVEVTCRKEQTDAVLAAIRRVHPYEEPVINVILLWKTGLPAETKGATK